MAPLPLDRLANTPEAFTANQSGQLTATQRQALLRSLTYDLQAPIEWPPFTHDWQLAAGGLILGWFLSFGIGLPAWIMGLFSLLAGVVYLGEALSNWLGFIRSKRADLKIAQRRLMAGDYHILAGVSEI